MTIVIRKKIHQKDRKMTLATNFSICTKKLVVDLYDCTKKLSFGLVLFNFFVRVRPSTFALAFLGALCFEVLCLFANGDIFADKIDTTEEKTDAFSFFDSNAFLGATNVRRFSFFTIATRA